MLFKIYPLGHLDTNCYLLSGDGRHAVIVDPADRGEFLAKQLEEQNLILDAICLTHVHHDHIGGLTALQAIGYKEFVDALMGRCSMQTATELVQQASRKYAKRQLTWFRRNSAIHWLCREENENTDQILAKARQILTEYDK